MEVLLIGAHDLLKLNYNASHPYAVVEFRGIKKKSEVIENDLSPLWKETMSFDLDGKALNHRETIEIIVKHNEKIGRNRDLGKCWGFGY